MPKILIVEDEKALSHALNLKLTNSGFEPTVASNGKEALEALAKQKFDLMILDLVMPIMDGFGVLTALQEKKSKLPVIVLSNLGQDEDIKKAKKLGADQFFVKANTPLAKIVELINTTLKK